MLGSAGGGNGATHRDTRAGAKPLPPAPQARDRGAGRGSPGPPTAVGSGGSDAGLAGLLPPALPACQPGLRNHILQCGAEPGRPDDRLLNLPRSLRNGSRRLPVCTALGLPRTHWCFAPGLRGSITHLDRLGDVRRRLPVRVGLSTHTRALGA